MQTKNSNVEWIGNIPEDWRVLPLTAIGSEVKLKNKTLQEQNLLSLSYGNIIRKDIESSFGLLPESFEGYQILEPGDMVFRFTDLQNDQVSLRSALATEEGIITNAYLGFRPRGIESAYLNYLMRSYDLQKVFYAMGAGLRQSLTYDDVKRLPVLLPPVHTQREIVSFLDIELQQMTKLIEKQLEMIGRLKERRQRVIWHGVTQSEKELDGVTGLNFDWRDIVPNNWKVKPLWTVTKFTTGWTPPSGNDEYYSDDYPWVNISDLGPRVVTSTAKGLSQLAANSLRLRLISEGQLMFSFKLSIGQVSFAGMSCFTNEAIATFSESKELLLDYAYYMLPICVPENAGQNIYGAKMLNAQRIKSSRIIIPPISEQENIAKRLDEATLKIDNLIAQAESVITSLKERSQSLIVSAVSGKILGRRQ